ncbi:MAG TPA: hypothetical protein DE038_06050 [Nitrospina sp.]|nr:hypothetical protein [Nitrospina sp.]
MPYMDGFQVMQKLKKVGPHSSASIVVLTVLSESS